MLSKQRRISKEIFEKVLKEGKNINSDHLYLRFAKDLDVGRPSEKKSRFAFIVSGKIAKRAVDRNLFKRRGRHIIKKNLEKTKEGYLYAFFAKKGIVEISFGELEKEVLLLLNKTN